MSSNPDPIAPPATDAGPDPDPTLARISAIVHELDGLDERPLVERAEAYHRLHSLLQEELAQVEQS